MLNIEDILTCPLSPINGTIGKHIIKPGEAIVIFDRQKKQSLVIAKSNLPKPPASLNKWEQQDPKKQQARQTQYQQYQDALGTMKSWLSNYYNFNYDESILPVQHEWANTMAKAYSEGNDDWMSAHSWLVPPVSTLDGEECTDIFIGKVYTALKQEIVDRRNIDHYYLLFKNLENYNFEIADSQMQTNIYFYIWMFDLDPLPLRVISEFISHLSELLQAGNEQEIESCRHFLKSLCIWDKFLQFFQNIPKTIGNYPLIVVSFELYLKHKLNTLQDFCEINEMEFQHDTELVKEYWKRISTLTEELAGITRQLRFHSELLETIAKIGFAQIKVDNVGNQNIKITWFEELINVGLDPNIILEGTCLLNWVLVYRHFELDEDFLKCLFKRGVALSNEVKTIVELQGFKDSGQQLMVSLYRYAKPVVERYLCNTVNNLDFRPPYTIDYVLQEYPGVVATVFFENNRDWAIHRAVRGNFYPIILSIAEHSPENLLIVDGSGKLPCELFTVTRVTPDSLKKVFNCLIKRSFIQAVRNRDTETSLKIIQCGEKAYDKNDLKKLLIEELQQEKSFTFYSIQWLIQQNYIDFLQLLPCLIKWLVNSGCGFLAEQLKLLQQLFGLARVDLNNVKSSEYILEVELLENIKNYVAEKYSQEKGMQLLTRDYSGRLYPGNEARLIEAISEELINPLDMELLRELTVQDPANFILAKLFFGAKNCRIVGEICQKLSLKVKKPLEKLLGDFSYQQDTVVINCLQAVAANQHIEFKESILCWLIGRGYVASYDSGTLKKIFPDMIDKLDKLKSATSSKAGALINLADVCSEHFREQRSPSVLSFRKPDYPALLQLEQDLKEIIHSFLKYDSLYERQYEAGDHVRAIEVLIKVYDNAFFQNQGKYKDIKPLLEWILPTLIKYAIPGSSTWMREVFDVKIDLNTQTYTLIVNSFEKREDRVWYIQALQTIVQFHMENLSIEAKWSYVSEQNQEKLTITFLPVLDPNKYSSLLEVLTTFRILPKMDEKQLKIHYFSKPNTNPKQSPSCAII